ncbi:uncharacterized protein FFM5_11121 [Fusarium fujikuroi]|nr:uncharacterized protein FFM5_11121 [Fusarium fujikuroi]
MQLKAVKII